MVCSACNDKPVEKACDTCGKLPPVLQINSEECPVLFHTVELEGTKEDNPPYIGMYKNTLLTYTADAAKFLFNSDGVYSAISGATEFDEILNRPKYGGVEMTSETDIPDVDAAVAGEAALREAADNALQNSIDAEAARATAAEQSLSSSLSSEVTARQAADSAIEGKLNGNVLYDLEMNADATAVEFVEDKKNLSTGTVTTETDTIPLASETQAGILNAAGYQSIKNSQDRLDALAGGAVSVSGLPANPTQAQLTTAWQTATELTDVFNRASIFDSTNGKNWTYFDNTEAWEVTGEVGQSITIENFSQGQAGLIVGDNQDGKVYAEQDGTGSVYGWDALKSRVTNTESNITTLDTDKQDKLTAGTNITIDQNTNTISASGGIPTDATFFGVSYDSTTNKVQVPSLPNLAFKNNGSSAFDIYPAYSNTNSPHLRLTTVGGMALFGRSGVQQLNFSWDSTYGYFNRFYHQVWLGDSIDSSMAQIKHMADPTDAQDAVTKNYTDNLAISYAALNGTTAPTTATEGKYVGQLYYDTTNEQLYFLKEIDDTTTPATYTWEAVGGGGSGIPTDATFWGASYDSTNNRVSGNMNLGGNDIISGSLRPYALATSYVSFNGSNQPIFKGSHVQLIGMGPTSSNEQTILSVRGTTAGQRISLQGTANTQTLRISGVTDPTDVQDAATKNYVDTAVASAGAATYTPSEFNNLWQEA